MKKQILFVLAAIALGACEGRIGNDVEPRGNGSAENKAEEGQLSISAPGVEMKINIPEGIRRETNINDDSGLVYPGSRMSGVHIEGGRDEQRSDGEVEMRFVSADPMERVVGWYRDPARANDFRLGGVGASGREGGHNPVVFGTTRENSEFQVSLSRRPDGGTEGRLLIRDR